jgi:hypothetical protein
MKYISTLLFMTATLLAQQYDVVLSNRASSLVLTRIAGAGLYRVRRKFARPRRVTVWVSNPNRGLRGTRSGEPRTFGHRPELNVV